MNLLRAHCVSKDELDAFLNNNNQLDKKYLLRDGYVVEINGCIEGCFIIQPIENNFFWLKSLYISQSKVNFLPLLFEAILALVKEKRAKKLFVHSHQPMVDKILEALRFTPQRESGFANDYVNRHGQWWSYNVS